MARAETGERLTYTMAEACQRLGISEDLGYQLAREGQIPILQLGRRKLIPRTALERMVAQAERAWEDRRDGREVPDQIRP